MHTESRLDVLIWDDGTSEADALAELVTRQGHRVTRCGSAQEALVALRDTPRALLLAGSGPGPQAAAALAQAAAAREVEVLNEELEAFYYSVTHDLRAPLRTIQGFCQMFLEDFQANVPAEGRALLDHVQAGTLRMDRMLEELLGLSRLARQPLQITDVDVEALVRSVATELIAAEPQRLFELQVGALGRCQADAGLLEQAVRRLVSNCIKFTRGRDPARIEFGRREEAGPPVFFVRDNGAGFDMKYAGKLFGAFQRMHTQTQFEGVGVGLAVVKRIVGRHGGRIWAESSPGSGTTFHFTLAPDPT
ncbi:MAG TPA: ATP-binding protein [Steroidobacteraceae bacterium]|nr:ATP-binding protein [Steroidobacteraceae bacterium]